MWRAHCRKSRSHFLCLWLCRVSGLHVLVWVILFSAVVLRKTSKGKDRKTELVHVLCFLFMTRTSTWRKGVVLACFGEAQQQQLAFHVQTCYKPVHSWHQKSFRAIPNDLAIKDHDSHQAERKFSAHLVSDSYWSIWRGQSYSRISMTQDVNGISMRSPYSESPFLVV